MKTYILLERSYATGSFGRHLNYHRGFFCELKQKQRIKGVIEFSTRQELPREVINAISDIATIAHEKNSQEFRKFLTSICKDELERFIKKPSLTTAKAMIKRVVEKVAKDEKINNMKTIKDKLRSINSAYRLNKGVENE